MIIAVKTFFEHFSLNFVGVTGMTTALIAQNNNFMSTSGCENLNHFNFVTKNLQVCYTEAIIQVSNKIDHATKILLNRGIGVNIF